MNAITEKKMLTATTSTKFEFTYDHVNQKIVGTDISFQKSGIPGSKQEAELMERMAAHPNYTFTVIETEKKPAKQTYKGLKIEVMEAYLSIYQGELADEMREQFAKMKVKHEEKKMPYSTIKSWFLDLFPKFNVEKAKREIQKANLENAKAPYKVVKVTLANAMVSQNQ